MKVVATNPFVPFNCSYLPSLSDKHIPCFYEPVECKALPNVTNAIIIKRSDNDTKYVGNTTIQYSCIDDTFEMQGISTASCLFNGHWSEPPKCTKESNLLQNPLLIVLPVFCVTFMVFILINYHQIRQKPKSITL